MPSTLDDLVFLSRFLGDPALDGAVLAEGNASARADAHSFWVKASGFSMRDLDANGLVRVNFEPIQEALTADIITDERVREVLKSSRAEHSSLMPSVETFMHAYLLGLPGVDFVGHTHPTALLSLLCSEEAETLSKLRLFPDEVVCCGPAAAFVPYVDPGFRLARAIQGAVERYVEEHAAVPKTIWMQNHGLIALGKSPREIESATVMSIKAARVWLGVLSSGCPFRPMTKEQIARIHNRPDEHYRQKLLWDIKN